VADSSPSNPSSPQRPSLPSAPDTTRSVSRLSVPPSEPRPSRGSLSVIDAHVDRPARLQLIIALLLGLVLVAIPLYLWRRPRAESIAVTAPADGGAAPVDTLGAGGSPPEERVTVSEPRLLSCHDPGPKKTPTEHCDRLADVEKALAKAVEESASCVPKDAGGGAIPFVAEVHFKKRTLSVTSPKEGRTLKNAKVAGACALALKAKLSSVQLDGMKHEHQRYRIGVTATYPGATKPQGP
jgi:hypothetical protein